MHLTEIRQYLERMMMGTGITPLFPLWERPTDELAEEMIEGGFRARIIGIDPRVSPSAPAGREYNREFLAALPARVASCAENGELHSFAFDDPVLSRWIAFTIGRIRCMRDGFIFTDLLPAENWGCCKNWRSSFSLPSVHRVNAKLAADHSFAARR